MKSSNPGFLQDVPVVVMYDCLGTDDGKIACGLFCGIRVKGGLRGCGAAEACVMLMNELEVVGVKRFRGWVRVLGSLVEIRYCFEHSGYFDRFFEVL